MAYKLSSVCMKFSRIISCMWSLTFSDWRWGDSNPWPPACKAGALPTELHPHYLGYLFLCNRTLEIFIEQWAWEDSNFRPHAYQACALTGWATSPRLFVWVSKTLGYYSFVIKARTFISLSWRPPILPHRRQCSTFGRLRLNHRVRDGNGCFP